MSQLNHLFPKLYFWKEAEKDWHKLDGSQKKFIAKGLLRIQENGANIGEELGNKKNSNFSKKIAVFYESYKIVLAKF